MPIPKQPWETETTGLPLGGVTLISEPTLTVTLEMERAGAKSGPRPSGAHGAGMSPPCPAATTRSGNSVRTALARDHGGGLGRGERLCGQQEGTEGRVTQHLGCQLGLTR